jgi:hypothetical protein
MIDGGPGPVSDTIVGNDDGDAFSITGPNAGNLMDGATALLGAGGFTDIENLTGGLGDDTFTFAAVGGPFLTGKIDGGGPGPNGNTIVGDNGLRTFTISASNAGTISTLLPGGFANIENLTGGVSGNTFKFFGAGLLTGAINGGSTVGLNTIVGNDAGDFFVINGTNSGTVTGLLGTGGFTNIGNLTGGLLGDTFQFVIGGSLAGAINGGGSGPNGNTIIGDDAGDSFAILGTNSGNLTQIGAAGNLLGAGGFTSIQNLTGGANDDVFVFITPGRLTGKIDGGGQSANGNIIVGDNNGDKFTIKGTDAGSIAAVLPSGFSDIQNLIGGSGADTFTFSGFGLLTGVIDGGGGNNTIVGNNSGDDFVINGGNAGLITSLLDNGFVNVQNLTGGSGADTVSLLPGGSIAGNISLLPGGSIAGNINGGNGRDTLDYSQFNLLVTTNLQTDTSTAIGTFASIENFVGTPADITNLVGSPVGAFDTFIGPNTSNIWAVTGTDSGTLNLLTSYAAYENLTGGTGQDVFRFSGGGHVDGKVTGGGGIDWLDYSLLSSGVSVNLSTGIASRTHSVTGIQDVLGSAGGGDTLTGNALANVLVGRVGNNTISGNGGNDIIIGGLGHNLLKGGSAQDLFIAGSTVFDFNITALGAFQAEWTSGKSFATRVADIQNGAGLTAGNRLRVGSTVSLAQAPGPRFGRGGGFYNSTIFGNGNNDLFFVRWASLIVDLNLSLDRTVGNPVV